MFLAFQQTVPNLYLLCLLLLFKTKLSPFVLMVRYLANQISQVLLFLLQALVFLHFYSLSQKQLAILFFLLLLLRPLLLDQDAWLNVIIQIPIKDNSLLLKLAFLVFSVALLICRERIIAVLDTLRIPLILEGYFRQTHTTF